MSRSSGRAYVFVRWSASLSNPGRLGDVGWAFEYNDRLGRFNCFCCGATEPAGVTLLSRSRFFWHEKCQTLPELIKSMSNRGPDHPGYDEVKVFEVKEADPELALQAVVQRSVSPDDVATRVDPLDETREILTRYGVRGLANSKGFSAPFLWYNMLPGRSVPLRKLPVHLFQLRVLADGPAPVTLADIEDHARRIAQAHPEVLNVGECFVGRIGSAYLVGLNAAVHPRLSVGQGRSIAEGLEQAIRGASPKVRHVFIQIEPFET